MIAYDKLQTFLILSDTLSFSKTADELNLSQPSVSRKIKELEEELGIQLFLRDHHRVVLTSHGTEFKGKISQPVTLLEEAVASLQEEHQSLSGKIRIASLTEVGKSTVMPLVIDFAVKYPNISVEVFYCKGNEIVEGIRNNKYDFGIVASIDDDVNIDAHKAIVEEHVLITSKNNATDPSEWKKSKNKAPFLAYRSDDPLFKMHKPKINRLFGNGNINIKCVVNSYQSMLDAVLALKAYAVVPLAAILNHTSKDRFRIIDTLSKDSKLYLIQFFNAHFDKKSRTFKEFLLDGLRSKI